MNNMYADMYKHINDGTFKPGDLLMERLEGAAYGHTEDGRVQRPTCAYTPPSDEITSREA